MKKRGVEPVAVRMFDIPFDSQGIMVSRPNRFLAIVDIVTPTATRGVKVHVRDPGRLEEILYPGNRLLLKRASINKRMKRKTDWDLVAGQVEGRAGKEWILVNSGYHRRIAEWVIDRPDIIPLDPGYYRAEQKLGESRIDFLHIAGKNKTWIEIKGCTLAVDGTALFPDAPTTRGVRHVRELMGARENGDGAALIILIFRPDAKIFQPKGDTDPDFEEIFYKALDAGVAVYPLAFRYENGTIYYLGHVSLGKF